MITQTQEDAILKEIWKGIYTVDNLPVPVYEENLKELTKGVAEGWGVALKDIPKERLKFKTLDSLVNNVDSFSAAKTFHQVADMEFLKVDKAGNIIPFSKFKKEAGTVFNTYNRNWLKTEFNTSKSQSQSAAQWSRIQAQKTDLPLLQYQTSGDERVRDEHVLWDNIIRPVGDPFWDSHMPPNGYRCRCEIIQLSSGKVSSIKSIPKNSAPLFSDNVGKTGQVFNEDEHPFFDGLSKNFDKNRGGL